MVDFGTLFVLVEHFHVWYVAATICGSAFGALVNFQLNRQWSFVAKDSVWQHQAKRYAAVSLLSLALNAGGVWYLTAQGGLKYGVSKVVISLFVALFVNYPLQRFYVFR